MFEDARITAEEENIVRKYVITKFFDVDLFIEYLNSHDTIDFEIFFKTNVGEKVSFSFLKAYKVLNRREFIRRIPIYFYDLKYDNDYINRLFRDYALTRYDDARPNSIVYRSEDVFRSDMDLEPVYLLLEKILYTFRIPFDKCFEYLSSHFGENFKSKIAFYWVDYLEQLDKVDETNVFPESLFYSINKLLLAHGKTPRLVMPEMTLNTKHSFDHETKKQTFSLEGFFPIDENGKLVMEWVGIWYEEIDEYRFMISEHTEDEIDFLFFGNRSPKSLVTIYFTVKPDSQIFVLGRSKNTSNEFVIQWEQVFSGSRVTKFTRLPLIERREKLKLSQKELAEMADINLRSYQRIEKGESYPDALNLIALMSILGIQSQEEFIARPIIVDNDYSKFRSGNKPSSYIEIDGKGVALIDEEE